MPSYAILHVSAPTFREIQTALEAAGYQHAFKEHDGLFVIDLHGVAICDDDGDLGPVSEAHYAREWPRKPTRGES